MATVTAKPQNDLEEALREWNSTNAEYPKDSCVHQLFEQRVKESPGSIALVYKDQRLTYRELDERANRLGNHLRKLGVGPDVLVGICMERCLDMIVSILGTLKAGGAYVPLDPAYPQERLASMLGEIKVEVLLTHEALAGRIAQGSAKVLFLDRDADSVAKESTEVPASNVGVHNLVYVIFTSGSTGKAKAAAVYHRGWTNLMHWFVSEFNITAQDKALLVSSFSFDITQRSIAMPLIRGGQLHLAASATYDPGLIFDTIDQEQITIMNCAPSTFYPIVENPLRPPLEKLSSLRLLFLGGEAISASRLRGWAESGGCKAEIVNVYGAAECSDVSSAYRLHDYQRYVASSVPIGKPIYNSRIYLVDETMNQVPFGEPGEICIAGDGVGKGYLNDEALTDKQFMPNPFESDPSSRLYRTGDMGRLLPDWNLEFIGRVDHQVKLRGFRIDLGDVESTLRQNQQVREAVVLMKGFGPSDQRLTAYLVPSRQSTTREELEDELRPFLKEKLPEYMVPSEFIRLDEMPLNPNGKIDRLALAELAPTGSGVKIGREEPRTATEREVASIIAGILKLERVGILDNFFEIGGNSFLLTEVLIPLCVNLQVNFPIADFLAGPTVAQIAKRIEELKGGGGSQ